MGVALAGGGRGRGVMGWWGWWWKLRETGEEKEETVEGVMKVMRRVSYHLRHPNLVQAHRKLAGFDAMSTPLHLRQSSTSLSERGEAVRQTRDKQHATDPLPTEYAVVLPVLVQEAVENRLSRKLRDPPNHDPR